MNNIKLLVSITLYLNIIAAHADSSNMLLCQTKTVQPGMSIGEVKEYCGEPLHESEEKEFMNCFNGYSEEAVCNLVKVKYLVYKRPTQFEIEFVNGVVSNVSLQILERSN